MISPAVDGRMSAKDKINDIQTYVSEVRSLITIVDDFAGDIKFGNLNPAERGSMTNMQNLSRLAVRHVVELDLLVEDLSSVLHGGSSRG
jgi:hypothetical protein